MAQTKWTPILLDLADSVAMPPKCVVQKPVHKDGFNPDSDGTLTPGQWAGNLGVESHWLSGAAAGEKWSPDSRLKKAEFEAAIDKAKNQTFGHHQHGAPVVAPVEVKAEKISPPTKAEKVKG